MLERSRRSRVMLHRNGIQPALNTQPHFFPQITKTFKIDRISEESERVQNPPEALTIFSFQRSQELCCGDKGFVTIEIGLSFGQRSYLGAIPNAQGLSIVNYIFSRFILFWVHHKNTAYRSCPYDHKAETNCSWMRPEEVGFRLLLVFNSRVTWLVKFHAHSSFFFIFRTDLGMGNDLKIQWKYSCTLRVNQIQIINSLEKWAGIRSSWS